MTDHPCKGMTKAQRKCFERIAINASVYARDSTLQALVKRGLIIGTERRSQDRYGAFVWTEYYVPLPIHYQWCQWASEQPGNNDDE